MVLDQVLEKDEIILDLRATKEEAIKSNAVVKNNKVSLLKSVAIYGANASGKSNILKVKMLLKLN